MHNVFDYIRAQRTSYETDHVPLMDDDEFSQYETIKMVHFYKRNKYLESATDSVIGDYPFDNISKFRVLLEARATDFDTKHIEVEPANPDRATRVKAMVSTKALRRYMNKIQFGKFINDLCITLPEYGGALVKRTEDGVFVCPWENLITDQSDIMGGIRIERHYPTPAEILKKKSWKNVDIAIRTASDRKEKSIGANQEEAKTQGDVIEIFELQGVIPLCMLKWAQAVRDGEDYDWADYDDDDKYKYVEATLVLCGADWYSKEKDENNNEYTKEGGIVLYAEEQETTHKYLARNPMVGRALGEGIPESLKEHQKWHNFTKTEEMRMIAIAGKKLYVTDDPDVLTNIYDEGVDHGTVLRVGASKTLKELNQLPTGTPIYQTIRQEWESSADKTTSSFNSKIGEEAKSGTPFRAQYLQNIEASSQFEQYREERGFLIKEIVEDWVLPDALKEMAEEDQIYASFTPQELQLIDEVLTTEQVNKEIIKRILDGEVITPEIQQEIITQVQTELSRQGTKRNIEKIKDFIKDAGGSVVVHTTDEARNKAVYFESLSNALALLAPEDPRRNALIDRIMDAIGITKEELELYADQGVVPGNPNPKLETKQLARSNAVGGELALSPA